MNWRFILIAVLIVSISVFGIYYLAGTKPVIQNNFSKDGNVVQNNPGLKPDTWYLVYEEPGKPGLSMELSFDRITQPNLMQGERVHVEGVLNDSVVSVSTISQIE